MSRPPETGICVLSIDLVSHGAAKTTTRQPSLDHLVELSHLLTEAKIPVTWCIGDAPTADVRTSNFASPDCEVALLADASWAAAGASRGCFSQTLAQHLQQLGSAGFSPTTLVLPQGCLASHDDLLVKHGIRVVRVSESRWQEQPAGWWPRGRSVPAKPVRALRWGLWQVQATADLANAGLRGVLRVVDRAARGGGYAIVVAQFDLLASGRDASRLVHHLRCRRNENALRLETLSSVASRLGAARPLTAARSILHSTAA
jgi:hypothetical protein